MFHKKESKPRKEGGIQERGGPTQEMKRILKSITPEQQLYSKPRGQPGRTETGAQRTPAGTSLIKMNRLSHMFEYIRNESVLGTQKN